VAVSCEDGNKLFHVLTAASMKMTAFRKKRRVVSMKYAEVSEVRTASIITTISGTSIYLTETTRRYTPEGCHLYSNEPFCYIKGQKFHYLSDY
jgi:hypothetical protein